jgi:hypothetical protein
MLLLSQILRVRLLEAVGLMEALWHWTARYAPRGDVGTFTNEMMASGVHWHGNPDKMIEALLLAKGASGFGWLEEHPQFRLVVHDWHEHADQAVKKVLLRAGATFWNGATPTVSGRRPDSVRTPSGRYPDSVHPQSGRCPDSVRTVSILARGSGSGCVNSQGEDEGDEAHHILRSAPELMSLTWVQDRLARNFALELGTGPGGWPGVARQVVTLATLAGPLSAPGTWLKAQYVRLLAEKKKGAVEAREREYRAETAAGMDAAEAVVEKASEGGR